MIHSTDRFLITHTGSLPRPAGLTQAVFAKEAGVPVDSTILSSTIRAAVAEVVRKQIAVGIDIVNDGEYSKPSYSTYIKDRLTGFEGASAPLEYQDLAPFPRLLERVLNDPGRTHRSMPACTGPIRFVGGASVENDLGDLDAAVQGTDAQETFLTAASPGVIALFFRNEYYRTREKYLVAIAEAMRAEYELIASAGATLQIDCPDLAMGRHIAFPHSTIDEFRREAALNVEVLNYALTNIEADRVRLHLCWGNYEGPHHCDVPLGDIIDIVLRVRASGISLEASNPRHAHEWQLFETVKLPEGMVVIPGVLESKSNFVEHPELVAQRIGRYARLVGRENVVVGSDCGFGTFVGQAAVDADVMWAKFEAMAEGARIATTRFW
jgi:5-methyltetrahydropteroyltriglutamate--homocysteine methyltransferase